uniref:linear amide C-N hydrolase n=1 Tax=Dokdonella sp. TaxID=2291710 RepID=UPI00260531D6
MNSKSLAKAVLAGVIAATATVAAVPSQACTRVVYLGANDDVITARSMDWKTDVGTNLWILPRGVERNGEAGPNTPRWTSRH